MIGTRIYHIVIKGKEPLHRLVRAGNQAQALRHVARDICTVEVATQDDLVELAKTVDVETAGDEI